MTGWLQKQGISRNENITFFIKKIFHMHNFIFSDELVKGKLNIF